MLGSHEKHVFGGLVKRGNQIWIVFGRFQGFFGPPELFLEVSGSFKMCNPEFCIKYRLL